MILIDEKDKLYFCWYKLHLKVALEIANVETCFINVMSFAAKRVWESARERERRLHSHGKEVRGLYDAEGRGGDVRD